MKFKKGSIFFLCALIVMNCAGCGTTKTTTTEADSNQDQQETQQETTAGTVNEGFSIDGFAQWAIDGGNAGTFSSSFLGGAENRPSDEELEMILTGANTYFQCHGLSGAHFLVIKSQEEQQAILPFFGIDTSGTVTVLVLADGVKAQEYHKDTYYPGSSSENGGNPEYWNMYFGIYEAGWASAYLNLAAIEYGYRTRAYAALNISNAMTGEVMLYGTGGNFEYITTENWDIEKYMVSADGTTTFDHYVAALDDTIDVDGNVTLLCAIVIGSVDETDTTTASTKDVSYKAGIKTNYDFWDKDYDPTTAVVDGESGATTEAEGE